MTVPDIPQQRQPHDDDRVTLGEIARNLGEFRGDVRGQLDAIRTDLTANYVPRPEVDLRFRAVDQRAGEIEADVLTVSTALDAHRREAAEWVRAKEEAHALDRRAFNLGFLWPLIVGVLLVVATGAMTVLITTH